MDNIHCVTWYLSDAVELEENYFQLRKTANLVSLYQNLLQIVEDLRVRSEDDRRARSHLELIVDLKLNDMERTTTQCNSES